MTNLKMKMTHPNPYVHCGFIDIGEFSLRLRMIGGLGATNQMVAGRSDRKHMVHLMSPVAYKYSEGHRV